MPVLKTKESEMMATIGLDAVCFLRFLRMCRNMYVLCCSSNTVRQLTRCTSSFLIVAALTCAILIPCDVVYNLRNVSSGNRNYLLMLTMAKVRGNYLW